MGRLQTGMLSGSVSVVLNYESVDFVLLFFKRGSAPVWEVGGHKGALLLQFGPSYGEQIKKGLPLREEAILSVKRG